MFKTYFVLTLSTSVNWISNLMACAGRRRVTRILFVVVLLSISLRSTDEKWVSVRRSSLALETFGRLDDGCWKYTFLCSLFVCVQAQLFEDSSTRIRLFFENGAFFLRILLPSTCKRSFWQLKPELFENGLQTVEFFNGGFLEPCGLRKTQVFKNDDVKCRGQSKWFENATYGRGFFRKRRKKTLRFQQ